MSNMVNIDHVKRCPNYPVHPEVYYCDLVIVYRTFILTYTALFRIMVYTYMMIMLKVKLYLISGCVTKMPDSTNVIDKVFSFEVCCILLYTALTNIG